MDWTDKFNQKITLSNMDIETILSKHVSFLEALKKVFAITFALYKVPLIASKKCI
jgi:hypothetical protein